MATQCQGCGGSGRVQIQRQHNMEDNPGGPEYEEQTCQSCGGSGWKEEEHR